MEYTDSTIAFTVETQLLDKSLYVNFNIYFTHYLQCKSRDMQ